MFSGSALTCTWKQSWKTTVKLFHLKIFAVRITSPLYSPHDGFECPELVRKKAVNAWLLLTTVPAGYSEVLVVNCSLVAVRFTSIFKPQQLRRHSVVNLVRLALATAFLRELGMSRHKSHTTSWCEISKRWTLHHFFFVSEIVCEISVATHFLLEKDLLILSQILSKTIDPFRLLDSARCC